MNSGAEPARASSGARWSRRRFLGAATATTAVAAIPAPAVPGQTPDASRPAPGGAGRPRPAPPERPAPPVHRHLHLGGGRRPGIGLAAYDGRLLFTANQRSGTGSVFRVDPASGALRPAGQPFTSPVAVCVLPL